MCAVVSIVKEVVGATLANGASVDIPCPVGGEEGVMSAQLEFAGTGAIITATLVGSLGGALIQPEEPVSVFSSKTPGRYLASFPAFPASNVALRLTNSGTVPATGLNVTIARVE